MKGTTNMVIWGDSKYKIEMINGGKVKKKSNIIYGLPLGVIKISYLGNIFHGMCLKYV